MLQFRPDSNVRPDRSRWILLLRAVANNFRTWLYFNLRCRWIIRQGMIRIPWSVNLWSPHRDMKFGHHVQFGRRCIVHCDAEFGDKIVIASDVAFIGRDDHRYDIVGKTMWDSPRGDGYKIIVEDDVWIGHGAIIIAGVTIGRGSVVAAGSVVNKDVPRYAIVAGVPARVVKWRFNEEEIVRHENLLRIIDETSEI